ncbi:MAG: hypothetical protein H7A23_12830 [Leptospiraceae bacterium]|nr:hypothetical protein [Leptospiraceae bacterium]
MSLTKMLFHSYKPFLVLFFAILFCKPADPNYRIKPLLNNNYNGFISRDFFQIVVEIPINPFFENSILEDRLYCKKRAYHIRDSLTLPILKNVAMQNEKNKKRLKIQEKKLKAFQKKQDNYTPKIIQEGYSESYDPEEITHSMIESKNPLLNRGDFFWFLDGMFLYKEDYADPKKCVYIFRNIQKGLYGKVESTILTQDTYTQEVTPSKAKDPNTNTNYPNGKK